jgi:hypothetical protein
MQRIAKMPSRNDHQNPRDGHSDPAYKEFWIAAQKNHIAVCTREIASLDAMSKAKASS